MVCVDWIPIQAVRQVRMAHLAQALLLAFTPLQLSALVVLL